MPRDTHDDGFHEIQLNGKQLVFLFMAATVVSVVIFLCGVLVGRGAGTGTPTVAEATFADELADDSISTPVPVDVTEALEGDAAAPTAAEDLEYAPPSEGERADDEPLTRSAPESERAAPVAETAVVTESAIEPPPRRSAAASAPPAATGGGESVLPAGDWAVQVAALNDSGDAELMARQWAEKGYEAYVVRPLDGTPAVYRVRIGTFKTRREADALASQLQREERISPWVTR